MRSRGAAFVALVVGGVLALVAGSRPWWRAVGEGVSVTFSGTEVTGGLTQALALVALAGTLLVLALRRRGRQVVGALVALAGAGLTLVGALRVRPSASAVRSQVREVSLADQFHLAGTAWPWVLAAAGVLVLAGGVLILTQAPRWPTRSDRFHRSGERLAAVSAADDPAAVWKAMDAGIDPTQDRETGRADHPDVQNPTSRDTMGSTEQTSQTSRSVE